MKAVYLKATITRKMVPITGRARSFLLVFKNKIERRGRQNKNNRPINLPNVITFSTDFKFWWEVILLVLVVITVNKLF